jgi:CheY-like chemotaxis protein
VTTKILVVEDVPGLRQDIAQLLEHEGYDVAEAGDGVEALEQAAAFQPDVIVLDIMLPGMDGFSVHEKIRADPDMPDVRVVYLTAKRDVRDVRRGLELGAIAYVTKPFTAIELLSAIRGDG